MTSPATTLALADPSVCEEIVRGFRLTVMAGPDEGRVFSSIAPKVVLGTHESADVALTDEAVSRFHCEISASGADITIRDLQSRNGTSLNGVRVMQAYLKDGSVLTVGRTQLRFDLRPDGVKVALSAQERFGRLVGRSPAMRRVFSVLERAAVTEASVLLYGETGTGKEVAAYSIHQASTRKDGPFVVVDCGAIPANLLEAELFGHEKGAFTGALTAREGAFAAADGGTIFLDEIGELGPDLQPKLLRVLESRQVKPIGSNRMRSVDVRIVAATNRDLKEEVNEKRFRADLYFRLAVIEATLPPLRERREDLVLLVEHLLEKLGARPEATDAMRSEASIEELERHAWPGNVRELRNYLERCLALDERVPLGREGEAGPASFQPDTRQPLKVARERWTRAFERVRERAAREARRKCGGGSARRRGRSDALLPPALALRFAVKGARPFRARLRASKMDETIAP